MSLTTLLCTDGSDLSLSALRDALPVLAPADRMVVLTVETLVDPRRETGSGFTINPESTNTAADADDQIVTSGDREAQRVLDLTVRELGLEGAYLMARSGTPGDVICRVAEEISASVIVMGTVGRSGFKRAMIGSTSDHVVRHAACPVLVQTAG